MGAGVGWGQKHVRAQACWSVPHCTPRGLKSRLPRSCVGSPGCGSHFCQAEGRRAPQWHQGGWNNSLGNAELPPIQTTPLSPQTLSWTPRPRSLWKTGEWRPMEAAPMGGRGHRLWRQVGVGARPALGHAGGVALSGRVTSLKRSFPICGTQFIIEPTS